MNGLEGKGRKPVITGYTRVIYQAPAAFHKDGETFDVSESRKVIETGISPEKALGWVFSEVLLETEEIGVEGQPIFVDVVSAVEVRLLNDEGGIDTIETYRPYSPLDARFYIEFNATLSVEVEKRYVCGPFFDSAFRALLYETGKALFYGDKLLVGASLAVIVDKDEGIEETVAIEAEFEQGAIVADEFDFFA